MSDEQPTERLPGFEEKVLAELASINVELTSINVRLTSLEEQAERRAMETKPIWERALNAVMELKGEVKDGFEEMDNKIGVLSEDVLKLRARIRTEAGKQELARKRG